MSIKWSLCNWGTIADAYQRSMAYLRPAVALPAGQEHAQNHGQCNGCFEKAIAKTVEAKKVE